MIIGILGGTGAMGQGLATRWRKAGHEVWLGSRNPSADSYTETNGFVAEKADVVVLAIPYSAQATTLQDVKPLVKGKLVITAVVPLMPPKVTRVWRPEGGSAAEEAQAILDNGARVVAAFQNIAAHHLQDPDHTIQSDVLIAGDKKADKEIAISLCEDADMRGINAGALTNASVVEGLTAVLIGINIREKVKGAGIKITGVT